ncbi:Anti-sigma-K factor rskA [Calidithermus terrae]|uniref:Regulator of SigK n=1 Tax=Calidithermus terrae TaxID=1408545 RepID=A0A399E8X4_9DEIN|nr:anti-sigma factor [Calidithermus terrae]RIH80368.1 Anti-sigma-K factor rskA [Calidithermus terrae]
MKPEELRELLPLYALDALPEAERQAVEEVLERHPELQAELRALLETAADLSQGVPPVAPRGELKARVMGRIRRAPPPGPKRSPWPRVLAQAAAVLLLAALAWGGGWAYRWWPWVQAFTDPKARVETLVDENGKAVGRAIYRPDGRTLVYVDLPPPPPGKTYQLWGVNQADHVALPTFEGKFVEFTMPPGFQEVHVTEEPEGGSPFPHEIRALPRD